MAWDLSNVIINLKAKIAEISTQIPGLATTSKAGIVKPDGTSITVNSEGTISSTVPVATTDAAGIVKPDGTSITIEDGVISTPVATTDAAGIVKPDGSSITIEDGVISTPVATTSAAGIVKPDGSSITIEDGVISAAGSESVTITKTSGETWANILARLCSAMDNTKLKGTSYINCAYDSHTFYIVRFLSGTSYQTNRQYTFGVQFELYSQVDATGLTLKLDNEHAGKAYNSAAGSESNISNNEYPGETITLYY